MNQSPCSSPSIFKHSPTTRVLTRTVHGLMNWASSRSKPTLINFWHSPIKIHWVVVFFFQPRNVLPILVRKERWAQRALPQWAGSLLTLLMLAERRNWCKVELRQQNMPGGLLCLLFQSHTWDFQGQILLLLFVYFNSHLQCTASSSKLRTCFKGWAVRALASETTLPPGPVQMPSSLLSGELSPPPDQLKKQLSAHSLKWGSEMAYLLRGRMTVWSTIQTENFPKRAPLIIMPG